MASVIQTVSTGIDKTVFALMRVGFSQRRALELIIDVCKMQIKQLETK